MPNPTLNRLIALGGTYNASPVQRYYAGRDARQRTDMNKLAMQSESQKIGAFPEANRLNNAQARQNMAVNRQAMDMKRVEAYGTMIAPILRPIVAEKDPKRKQAMYQMAIPAIKDAAKLHGASTANIPDQFDQQKAEAIVSQFSTDDYSKINPSQYTQESIKKYDITKNKGDLVAREKGPLVKNVIDMANKGTESATQAYGTGVGEAGTERNKFAASAMKQKAQLETVALAIENGAKTGKWEEAFMEAKSLGKTLGIPGIGDLSGQELIRTVSNEMALRLRNPDSGLGLTGNTSNKDLEFLKASVVGLGRTEEGNLEIIRLLNKFNDMVIDVAMEQNRTIMKNGGTVPMDLDARLLEYANNYKFFEEGEREKIDKILGKTKESFEGMTETQIKRLEELRRQQGR